eukprot:jgi/Bigna1/139539/aug1.51_g14247
MATEAEGLVEALKRTSFRPLPSPKALQWMYQINNPRTQEFLRWFQTNVNQDNILTRTEKAEYLNLEEKKLLKGKEELKNALDIALSERKETSASLQKEIANHDDEIKKAERQLKLLVQQRNALTEHNGLLSSELERQESYRKESMSNMRKAEVTSRHASEKFDSELRNLAGGCEKYKLDFIEGKGREQSKTKYLFQMNLHDYRNAEIGFSKALNHYWGRQFHPSFEQELKPKDDASEFLDFANVETTSLSMGKEEKAALKEVWREMIRLQGVYKISMAQWVRAGEELAKVYAGDREKQQGKLRRDGGIIALDGSEIDQLKLENEKLEKKRDSLYTQVDILLNELQQLQVQPVLLGNYQLKCARYRYYSEKLRYLRKSIVSQIARKRVLIKGLKTEQSILRKASTLVSDLSRCLEGEGEAQRGRISEYKRLSEKNQMNQKNTIDARDELMNTVKSLIRSNSQEVSIGSDKFVSYKTLESLVRRRLLSTTNEEILDIKQRQETLLEKRMDTLSNLLSKTFGLEDVQLHGRWPKPENFSRVSLHSLQPKRFLQSLDSFDKLQNTLHQEVANLKGEFSAIQQKLNANRSDTRIRRGLFVNFFTKRDKLAADWEEMKKRIDAQTI